MGRVHGSAIRLAGSAGWAMAGRASLLGYLVVLCACPGDVHADVRRSLSHSGIFITAALTKEPFPGLRAHDPEGS